MKKIENISKNKQFSKEDLIKLIQDAQKETDHIIEEIKPTWNDQV